MELIPENVGTPELAKKHLHKQKFLKKNVIIFESTPNKTNWNINKYQLWKIY